MLYKKYLEEDGVRRYFRRGDAALWAAVLLFAGIVLLIFAGAKPGSCAEVWRNGAKIQEIPLSRNADYVIAGAEGNLYAEVRDGVLRVTDADCPDHVCVNTGAISREGQTIICLPNRVELRIPRTEKTGVDGIAG